MNNLLKYSDIPKIKDLQEALGVPITGTYDEPTLNELEFQLVESDFANSKYFKDLQKEHKPENTEEFLVKTAVKLILKEKYKQDMDKIQEFLAECWDDKIKSSGLTIVEMDYDPEHFGSDEYRQIFEQGGRIVKYEDGSKITNKPESMVATVAELRAFAAKMGGKFAKKKVFDNLPDDTQVKIYNNNGQYEFEVVGEPGQIGVAKGQGALNPSNWFGKGNVRASNVIGAFTSANRDRFGGEAAKEEATVDGKTEASIIEICGKQTRVVANAEGVVQSPTKYAGYIVQGDMLFNEATGEVDDCPEAESPIDTNAGTNTAVPPVVSTGGGGSSLPSDFTECWGNDVGAFQDAYNGSNLPSIDRYGGGTKVRKDNKWGPETAQAWANAKGTAGFCPNKQSGGGSSDCDAKVQKVVDEVAAKPTVIMTVHGIKATIGILVKEGCLSDADATLLKNKLDANYKANSTDGAVATTPPVATTTDGDNSSIIPEVGSGIFGALTDSKNKWLKGAGYVGAAGTAIADAVTTGDPYQLATNAGAALFGNRAANIGKTVTPQVGGWMNKQYKAGQEAFSNTKNKAGEVITKGREKVAGAIAPGAKAASGVEKTSSVINGSNSSKIEAIKKEMTRMQMPLNPKDVSKVLEFLGKYPKSTIAQAVAKIQVASNKQGGKLFKKGGAFKFVNKFHNGR